MLEKKQSGRYFLPDFCIRLIKGYFRTFFPAHLFLIAASAVFFSIITACAGHVDREKSFTVRENEAETGLPLPLKEYGAPGKNVFEIICNTPEDDSSLFFYGFSPVYSEKAEAERIVMSDAAGKYMLFRYLEAEYTAHIDRTGAAGSVSRKLNVETLGIDEKDIFKKLKLFYNSSDPGIPFAIYSTGREEVIEEAVAGLTGSWYSFSSIERSVQDRQPGWITVIPESEKYIFSTGSSGRYSSLSESIARADMNAAEEMAKQVSVSVKTAPESGGTGGIYFEHSKAELRGFYIIRRWWPPDMRTFYSLAVSLKGPDG